MPFLRIIAILATLEFLFAPSSFAAQSRRVAVYPENHHYLMNANGKPLLLIGYGNELLNDAATLDLLKGHITYIRSYFAIFFRKYGWNSHWQHEPWRVVGSKVDMDTWNSAYWAAVSAKLKAAQDRNIIVGITIWDGHTALPGGHAGSESVWNADNNMQGIQWAYDVAALKKYPHPTNTGGAPERLVYYQRRVVDKLLTEIKPFPNVIIELNNEESPGASTAWWLWWAEYFKSKGYVVAVNEAHSGGIQDHVFASSHYLDVKFYHHRTASVLTPARYKFGKVVAADGDTACTDLDADKARRTAWKSVLRGGGWNDFVCMQQPFPDQIKLRYYGHLLDFFASRELPFWRMIPMGQISSSGYVLTQPGLNYIVYASKDINVDLSRTSGSFRYQWYDPRSGTIAGSGTVSGGTSRNFNVPSADDYILWITRNRNG